MDAHEALHSFHQIPACGVGSATPGRHCSQVPRRAERFRIGWHYPKGLHQGQTAGGGAGDQFARRQPVAILIDLGSHFFRKIRGRIFFRLNGSIDTLALTLLQPHDVTDSTS